MRLRLAEGATVFLMTGERDPAYRAALAGRYRIVTALDFAEPAAGFGGGRPGTGQLPALRGGEGGGAGRPGAHRAVAGTGRRVGGYDASGVVAVRRLRPAGVVTGAPGEARDG